MRRRLVAFGPPAVVALLGVVTVLGVRRERTEAHWVAHTQSARLAISTVFTSLRDAEAGVRGYLLTGDSASLLAYRTRLPIVPITIDSIRLLTADNPDQRARVAILDSLATLKDRELNAVVALTSAGRRDSALKVVVGSQSMRVVNKIRSLLTVMDSVEKKLLEQRERGLERQRRLVLTIVVVGTVHAAALALLALELLAHSGRQLQAQADELAMSRDELIATAVELTARTRAAEDANRAKAEFLTTMSHELRTPLNAIDGYAELLEMGLRGPVTPEQEKDLARIRRSQRHLLALVNDVLNFARLEAGRIEWQITDVLLDDTLQSVEALLRPQLETKEIAYHRTGCDPAVLVRADAEKLRQILVNLIGNAYKFTAAGGEIAIECDVRETEVAITVRDSGRGIPADKLSTIFDPFVQIDRHLTHDARKGIGLGLSISRDLARGMNGELTVRSTLGVGSEFTLTIPRGGASLGRLESAASSVPASTT